MSTHQTLFDELSRLEPIGEDVDFSRNACDTRTGKPRRQQR